MVELDNSFSVDESALDELLDQIRSGTLLCAKHVQVNGDDRFWGVGDEFTIVAKFREVARKMYKGHLGSEPKHLIVMANYIASEKSTDGSGGGWHVDSIKNQYKAFMYLTDCVEGDNGPLTLLTSGSKLKDRMYVIANYLKGNKFRFSSEIVNKMCEKGFAPKQILLRKLVPFFVNTSFLHRGGEITEGERIMLTAYMFEEIPKSIQARVAPDDN